MKPTTRWLLIITAVALMLAGLATQRACSTSRENQRLESNQRSLLEGIDHYRTADSLSAAGVEQLTINNDELREYNARLEKTCRDLGIKLKRMQGASTTATESELTVTMPLHDTIYIKVNDTTPTKAQHFRWDDNWTTIDGLIEGDSTTCHISNRDTITIITHRVPKRWLFFRCGTKSIRTEAVSSNPHTEIKWLESVKIEE